MLVRTPTPYPTESLFSFIIRVSEINGYETPQTILNYAGYKDGEIRSTKLSIKKLAIILNCTESDLNKISYNKYDHNNQLKIKLLNHDLGFTARDFLRSKKQIFCPECVIENGFVEAFWDLNLAIYCPEHKSIPIETCPNCNQKIKFLRPGLLKCSCGHKLLPLKNNKYTVHISVLELMSILKYKLENKFLIELSNTSKSIFSLVNKVPLVPSQVAITLILNRFLLLHPPMSQE